MSASVRSPLAAARRTKLGVAALLLLVAGACRDFPRMRSSPDASAPPVVDAGSAGSGGSSTSLPDVPDASAMPEDRDASVVGSGPGPLSDVGELRVTRVRAWPGRGVQVVLGARDEDSAVIGFSEWSGLLEARLADEGVDAGEEVLGQSLARLAPSRALTLVVVQPSEDTTLHAARVESAKALIRALGEGEKIALYGVTDGIPRQLADSSARHDNHLRQLDRLAASPSPTLSNGQFSLLAEELRSLEGRWAFASRSIVVVGAELDPTWKRELEVTAYALHERATELDESGDSAGWNGDVTPEEAGRALAAHMNRARRESGVLGLCPSSSRAATVELDLGTKQETITLPRPLSHFANGTCDPTSIARDAYPFPPTIEIVQDRVETAEWEENHAANSRAVMNMGVRFGDGMPIRALGNFRGRTSLKCARKSLTIDLEDTSEDPAPRLVGGSATDEFLLISMCKDEGFFRQVFTDRILATMDLFDFEFRLVQLKHNGASLGAYLLLEKANHTIRKMLLGESLVIRREHDGLDRAPVLHFPEDPALATEQLAAYEVLGQIALEGDPETLTADLDARLDFDNYLRWLAVNTYFQNGDYVDEVWFFASQPVDGEYYFRLAAWDPDDVQNECHENGENEIPDPRGLSYCHEANLDHSIVRSGEAFERYVYHLEQIHRDYPPERVETLLDAVHDDIMAVLPDDAACRAMDQGTTCSALSAHIQSETAQFVVGLEEWRAELEANLALLGRTP